MAVAVVNEYNAAAINQGFCVHLIQLALRICSAAGKVNLSALTVISAATHVKRVQLAEQHADLMRVFEAGAGDADPAVQQEVARVVGDYANALEELNPACQAQGPLFELATRILNSEQLAAT